MSKTLFYSIVLQLICMGFVGNAQAQIGKRFPSERKVVTDPVTGTELVFLTSTPAGDSKIYQTHNQWTSDGKWLIFRSNRVKGEALAVNEESGDIVQVTEGGYLGMLNVARKSMKLYFMRIPKSQTSKGALEIVEVDLARVLADSKTGNMQAPGQIVFCWETGGKAPQRTWIVNSDGTGLRPLYPESDYEWVTHEAIISADEVAFAIMGHRPVVSSDTLNPGTDVSGANPGQEKAWGPSGTREKPTGLGIVNIRIREMHIAGQIPEGSGFWHVAGSADKRFVAGDDFARNIYLINRETHEMILLSTGHKTTAADHPHPTFSPDGTRIQIQSAMLSEDNRSMNICIIHVPLKWLKNQDASK